MGPPKIALVFGHTLIEYLHDGLTWEKSFANEKVPFQQMTIGAFSEMHFMYIFLGLSCYLLLNWYVGMSVVCNMQGLNTT